MAVSSTRGSELFGAAIGGNPRVIALCLRTVWLAIQAEPPTNTWPKWSEVPFDRNPFGLHLDSKKPPEEGPRFVTL